MSANAPDSLVDDIIAYYLQGSYQRAAQAMLDAGVIHKETRT